MFAVFWIIIGVVVLAACFGGKKQTGQKKALRIDHPHYYDKDDFECSVCGARFHKSSMVYPGCGARFEGTKEDDTEFAEEMMDEEDWDEEEESQEGL